MSVEWGASVKEYKHEFLVLLGVLIVIKIFLALSGKMPLWSFSFVEDNQANTALAAGTAASQAASRLVPDEMSAYYGSN